jgi:hypothetical protein
MNVHLVLPDLFWPQPDARDAEAGLDLPALQRLLARGRRTRRPAATLEAWVADRYGIAPSPDRALAPLSLLADGGSPGAGAWLRADPCHFRLGTDHIVLVDAATFAIDRGEADALTAALNAQLSPDGLTFHAPRPERWYIAAEHAPQMETTPLAAARGRSVDPLLPRGADARAWHARLNEVQMVLHAHPVNEAREGRGAPPINSVWPWGGGTFTVPTVRPFRRVHAEDPVIRGAAQASGAAVAPLSLEARPWDEASASSGIEAVALDMLSVPAAYGDVGEWRERLDAIERRWIGPAVDALAAGRIGMITLHALGAAGSLEVELTRQDLRYFWRRVKPVGSWRPVEARP